MANLEKGLTLLPHAPATLGELFCSCSGNCWASLCRATELTQLWTRPCNKSRLLLMDAATSPPDLGVGLGVSILCICFFFFLSPFIPFLLNFLFYSLFFYPMDKSFYLKITFIQRVILPNYGVIKLSTFGLFKQPLIIRNFPLHFWPKLFFMISIVLSSCTLWLSSQHGR